MATLSISPKDGLDPAVLEADPHSIGILDALDLHLAGEERRAAARTLLRRRLCIALALLTVGGGLAIWLR